MKLRYLLTKLSPSSSCTVTVHNLHGGELHKGTAKSLVGSMEALPEWLLGSTVDRFTINAYTTRMEVAIYIKLRREYGGGKKK